MLYLSYNTVLSSFAFIRNENNCRENHVFPHFKRQFSK